MSNSNSTVNSTSSCIEVKTGGHVGGSKSEAESLDVNFWSFAMAMQVNNRKPINVGWEFGWRLWLSIYKRHLFARKRSPAHRARILMPWTNHFFLFGAGISQIVSFFKFCFSYSCEIVVKTQKTQRESTRQFLLFCNQE